MEIPSATFCNGKYSVLNHFCFSEFLAYYTFENKSAPDEFDDNLIENNYEKCSYPEKLKSMISRGTMRC